MKKKKNFIISVFVAFLIFSGGYVLGYERSLPTGGFFPQITNKFSEKSVDFGLFWKAWDTVSDKYDGSLDPQKMLYGAISGMVESTGDPYTVFLDPEEAKTFEEDLAGTFSGIGAEIGIKKDRLTVIAPLPDSPAEKAGLRAGDLINKINDEDTLGMNVDEAVRKIRGEAGTEVKLTIERNKEEKEYKIKREKIDVKSVKYSIENSVLIIKVSRFDENTISLIQEAESEGISKGVKGVILDLRNNPGGLLDSAIDVSSEFVDKGVVVTEKEEKKNRSHSYKASGKGKMTDLEKYPLVVLVNEGSASASEIVAGAIRDNGRGQLLGEKTFGKGSVQEIIKLPGGSELKITVAHWYTPKGVNLSKEGLKPDIEVKLTDEDFNNDRDPQLTEAMKLLQ
ncbi:S41 family peptidase [candidate division WS5 bacterium]|uniref:S41 family peptidase n=1 Tax=candidate division WS5 bacterium TaxID=2093353 RepID=A0A419DA30_9BACT|nr:MAG: S41 family peptidase [candidate division WS5 bacterium]